MAIPIDDFVAATESAKSYLSRFQSAMAEYQQTGNWMGEKYGVAFSDAGAPSTRTREAIAQFEADKPGFIQKNFGEERFKKRISELQDNVGRAGFREERKRMRIAQNVTDVEDFSEEEWESLVRRNQELKQMDEVSLGKHFDSFSVKIPGTEARTDYVTHVGAPELIDGKLDPNFTRSGLGSTKSLNDTRVEEAKRKLASLEENLQIQKNMRYGSRRHS